MTAHANIGPCAIRRLSTALSTSDAFHGTTGHSQTLSDTNETTAREIDQVMQSKEECEWLVLERSGTANGLLPGGRFENQPTPEPDAQPFQSHVEVDLTHGLAPDRAIGTIDPPRRQKLQTEAMWPKTSTGEVCCNE